MGMDHSLGLMFLLVFASFSPQSSSNPVTSVSSEVLQVPDCNPTALHKAVSERNIEAVQSAIDNGTDMYALDCQGKSAMHLAIELDKPDMITALIENDFDVNYAFKKGESVIFFAVRQGRLEAVKTLISFGSNVNMLSVEGSTPLLEALIVNKEGIISLLKEHKATYEGTFVGGDTSLHRAAQSGSIRSILMLLKLNLSIEQKNLKGETPLFKAVTHNHPAAVNLFLSRGADATLNTVSGETITYQAVTSKSLNSLRALLEYSVNPDSVNDDGFSTPLLGATIVNSRAAAELLVQFQADLNKVWEIERGMNLLHMATKYSDARSLPWLVEMGLNVNSTDKRNFTALHYAAFYNKIDAAKELFKLNACRTCTSDNGKTPHDMSRSKEMKDLFAQ